MAVVLITGCSSGFGQRTALEARRRGHVVYAGVRRAESLAAVARDGHLALELDVTREDHRTAAVARILAEQGRIDALVNNAGVVLGGFLEDVDEDELRRLFDVNVFGAWAMTQACLPAMRRERAGTVVMVSSVSGILALPGLGAYASSKFAVEGMAEAWRHELAPFGVRVVLLQPGAYRTEIFEKNRWIARRAEDPGGPYARFVAKLDALARQGAAQADDPQDVAVRICDLLEASRPALRHPMGPGARARSLAKRFVPFSVIEQVIRRVAGLTDGPQR